MRPTSSGGRFAGGDDGKSAIEAYLALWCGGEPSLDRFLADLGPPLPTSLLGSLVKLDLQMRFERGQRPTAAAYLGRFPELAGSSDRAISLIYEEFCLLEENGEEPDSARFCEEYEPWRDSLASQLIYHRELSRVVGAEVKPTKFPKVGDRFATYQLLSVLGSGGAARVYLATDDHLGGRKVALKVSASVGREPSILANLDHRNIVPILTVAESETGLRGFCMPYRPGVTLEELIGRIGQSAVPRRARTLWEALRPKDAAEVDGLGRIDPGWSDFPIEGTYAEAVAWIGLALANALAYLHGRQVLHRDIKPANVLLAYREGPQLLDFNLAHAPNAPEHAQAALKGGTLPFMAPEQLRAFLDPAGWDEVRSPADLYALGLVLRGLVTGQSPELPDPSLKLPRAIQALHDRRSEPAASIRASNPAVPPAFESIIEKCLEFDPSKRYAEASALAEDLRRFLARRPLASADNPSMLERWSNCLYRNRFLAAGLVALMATLVTALMVGSMASRAPAPISIREIPEFQSAAEALHAGDPANLERARERFDRLSRIHPRSAWPRLYLAVTTEKLAPGFVKAGHKDQAAFALKAANQGLRDAALLDDFELAFNRRFAEDAHSATMNTFLGLRFLENRIDPRRFAKAYPYLIRAVESEPDRIVALTKLGEAEARLGRPDDAIAHLLRAIELGERKPELFASLINTCRGSLLPLLSEQVNRQLARDHSAAGHSMARRLLDRLESTMEALAWTWVEGPPEGVALGREYCRLYYGGAVASGRAYLAKVDGDLGSAERGFEEASEWFEAALRAGQDGVTKAEADAIGEQVAIRHHELEVRAGRTSGGRGPL